MDNNYEIIIIKYLIDNKINITSKGYIYLLHAIEMGLQNIEFVYNLVQLYDLVAEKNNTKAINVERAIRLAIHSTGMTNKHFISLSVYKIKYGDRIDFDDSCLEE